MNVSSFITAGRDAEARLVVLLAEVDADTADRVRLRLALGLSVAEVTAARVVDVSIIDREGFLAVPDVARDRVRLLPLGTLYSEVIEPRVRGARTGARIFPPLDLATSARAFAHAAAEFPGIDDDAVGLHHAHRHAPPKTSNERRAEAAIAKGRLPPGFGWV